MKPVLNADQCRKDVSEAFAGVRMFAKTEAFDAFVAYVESLIAGQQAHMAQCGSGLLPTAQIRLKQLAAIRSALLDPNSCTTGSTYD